MGLIKQEKPNKARAQQFTWDSFLEYYNELIDEEIISFCRVNKYAYYGGKCTITSEVKEDEFTKKTLLIVVSVLYYEEKLTQKILERKISSKFDYREFKKDDKTLSMLRSVCLKPVEFDIEPPAIMKGDS